MYKLTTELRTKLQASIVLENMINYKEVYPILLDDTPYRSVLKPVIEDLAMKDAIAIEGTNYVPTAKGRQILEGYLKKYHEFIRFYDVFNAVNLTAPELTNDVFALNKYWDFETDEEYNAYAKQPQFTDLRCQILEFKGLNPIEYVFMSFIAEGRFDLENDDWEFRLMSQEIFDEILEICNTFDGVADEEKDVVIPLIIEAGVNLLKEQKEEEDRINEEERQFEEQQRQEEQARLAEERANHQHEEEVIEEVVTYVEYVEEPVYEIGYYDYYYDPFYVPIYWEDDYYYW